MLNYMFYLHFTYNERRLLEYYNERRIKEYKEITQNIDLYIKEI